MKGSHHVRSRDLSSRTDTKSATTESERLPESKPFANQRSRSEGRLSDSMDMDMGRIEDTGGPSQKELKGQKKGNNEPISEVIRRNDVITELRREIEVLTLRLARASDLNRGLQDLLVEEKARQQAAAEHYNAVVHDRDVHIQELRRKIETQLVDKDHELESHSRIAQEIGHVLETERRSWRLEKDMLQSELNGTRQLFQEQQEETRQYRQDAQAAEERAYQYERELDNLTSKHEALIAEKRPEVDAEASRQELETRHRETTLLRSKLSKACDSIEENHQRAEAELAELRNRLAAALDDREKAVSELHAFREKELTRQAIAESTISNLTGNSGSGGASSNALLAEQCSKLESELEKLKSELEAERENSQMTRVHLEDELRMNRQLDAENKDLKNNLDTGRTLGFQGRQLDRGVAGNIHSNLEQLQETLRAAQSQATNLLTKQKSSQSLHHASTLNISLQEAQHHVDDMRCYLEESMAIQPRTEEVASSSKEELPQKRRFSIDRRFRSLFRSGSSSTGTGSRKNKGDTSQRLKLELEDLRKECVNLLRENFTLEQCVRYLGARCQLYQTIYYAREGRNYRSAAERLLYSHTSKRPIAVRSRGGSSIAGPSAGVGHTQIDPMREILSTESARAITGMAAFNPSTIVDESPMVNTVPTNREERGEEASTTSSSGQIQMMGVGDQVAGGGSEGPSISRNLELKLLSKISTICEPFSQFVDSALVLTGLQHLPHTPSIMTQ